MAKILIVEDEEVLLNVLKSKLTKEGYEVSEARNGQDGLEKIREEKPGLVLLDIVMPVMGGFELMKELAKDKSVKFPPIIVISNSGQPVEIEEAKRLGAKDYLVKAEFDPQEVIEKVRLYLGEKPAPKKEGVRPTPSAKPGKPSLGKKILIIEDDKFLRDLIVQKLQKEGFEISEAIDGEVGLKKIEEEKPDLILLDLILPGMDGFEVMEKMKQNSAIASIPVVILSNLGQREDVERGLKLGAKDYLIKAHFTPGEIIEKIKSNLP